MKRSRINKVIREAVTFGKKHGWEFPPNPRWDITDFGLGDFDQYGLVLINLAEEPEYCEKLMYARKDQITPAHTHIRKKEDIVVRKGELAVKVWKGPPGENEDTFMIQINNIQRQVKSGDIITLKGGERVTLLPGIYHEFYPMSEGCLIGEVSTYNDDINDNIFHNENVGRFSQIEEDEPPLVKLVSD